MFEQELIAVGFNEKEAKVYLSSLELGQSTVQNIARKAAVNRATAYFIIDSLMQRGLMSSFHKGKKQYFVAADPERLLEIMDQEKENIEKKKENLNKLLPQLQSLNNKQKGKPVVKYYEGKEGIKAMLDEFLKYSGKGTAHMAYSVDAINNFFQNKEVSSWRSKRAGKGIKTKSIYTFKDGARESTEDSQRRKVPFEKFPITCDISVYDDKVRLASLGDRLTGIIIEDKEIAQSLRSILNLAWEAAEKYEDK